MEQIGVIDARARQQVAEDRADMAVVRAIVEIRALGAQPRAVVAKPAARGAQHREIDVDREADGRLDRRTAVLGRENHLADALACRDASRRPVPEPVGAALLVVARAGPVDHVVAPQRELDRVGIGHRAARPVEVAQAAADMAQRMVVTRRFAITSREVRIDGFGVLAAAA